MALIKCKNCNNDISDKATNCIHCGCPIITEEKIFCKECGNELNINDSVCNRCGCPIKNESLQQEQITFRQNDIEQQKPIVEQQNKLNKNTTNSITKKGNPFLNIIRYLIGFFFLLCALLSFKGLGVILGIVAVLMILPISANFIYSKIKIAKSLKIILPILFFIIAISFVSNDTTNVSNSNLNTYGVCRKNISRGVASGSETIFLNGNNKTTNIEKKFHVNSLDLGNGTELGDLSIIDLCSDETKLANKYSNASVNCNANDGNDINITYTNKNNIKTIIEEYNKDDYQCLIYNNGNNKKEIIGNWCLEFDNNGNTNTYKYVFDENGYYTETRIFGENGKYTVEKEGYYSFDGTRIKQIDFVKGSNFYGSSFSDFLTYNSKDNTLTNSNIDSKFPNVFTKCD